MTHLRAMRLTPVWTLARVLAAGLALNIAIAVGVQVLQSGRNPFSALHTESHDAAWPMSVPEWWPGAAQKREVRAGLGWSSTYSEYRRQGAPVRTRTNGGPWVEAPGRDYFCVWETRYGWPWRAVYRVRGYEEWVENGAYRLGQPHPDDLRAGLEFPTLGSLAVAPEWAGLVLNTGFYTLLWWLAFASIGRIKHNRRYRRGLCPMCRYDLMSDYSHGCSECGWGRT